MLGKTVVAVALAVLALAPVARADDRVDTTVSWFSERRPGKQSLTVLHPQFDVGLDLGQTTTLGAGYEADVVTGATASVYAASLTGEPVDVVTGATQMSDQRHVGRASLSFRGRRSSLDVGYVFGTERDYRSHTISAGGSVDLPGRNTTFSLSYAHNIDQVCDLDNGDATPLERRPLTAENDCFTDAAGAGTVIHDLSIDTTQATLTQNVSPTLVLQLGVHGQVLSGFQSNPYRRVRVSGFDAQENVPSVRGRAALFARANIAFPAAHAALGILVRGYSDTWGVDSGTAEMTYSQYVGKALLVRLRTRVYQQSAAVFFRDAIDYQSYGPAGAYFTGDRELSPLRDVVVGVKLAYLATGQEGRQVWGFLDTLDFHIRADAIWAQSLTETPPGGDPAGPMPDSFVLSAGLLLRY